MKDFNDVLKEQRKYVAVKNKMLYKIFEAIQMQTLDFANQYIVSMKTNPYSNAITIVLEDLMTHDKYTISISKED